MPEVTLVEAVTLALARAMEEDPSVVVFGEDVGINGGVFRATAGLQQRFGSERVMDTPLSELLISGLCVGMAVHQILLVLVLRDHAAALALPDLMHLDFLRRLVVCWGA